MNAQGLHRGLKRLLVTLELELQTVATRHVDAGSCICVLFKHSKFSAEPSLQSQAWLLLCSSLLSIITFCSPRPAVLNLQGSQSCWVLNNPFTPKTIGVATKMILWLVVTTALGTVLEGCSIRKVEDCCLRL